MEGAGLVLSALALNACTSDTHGQGENIVPHTTMESQEVSQPVDLLQSPAWSYLDGAQVVPRGLSLTPTGLSIINKRAGDTYKPDPPLEVYGPRLEASGDFAVSTHIESATAVSLQLYGAPPLRFDDFRYERSRIECTQDNRTLTVRMWDGSSQTPVALAAMQLTAQTETPDLTVQRRTSDMVFLSGGHVIGTARGAGKLFASGQVWFGLNSEHGPARVSYLIAQPLQNGKLKTIDTTTLKITKKLPDGLQTLVRKSNFRIGSAIALNPVLSDMRYAELFLGGEIGSMTTENALKPQDVQPLEGSFTFGKSDAVMQLAERHGLDVHGHTLFYTKAMPKWMADLPPDKQRLEQVLTTHIAMVAGHFKGRMASWDVMNEIISGFNQDAALEDNVWFQTCGEELIDIAFHAAHQADPNAKLYLNDYGLETNPQGRGQCMLDLCKRLLSRGVPIHGVGMQGHVYEMPRDSIHSDTLRHLMDEFGKLGLLVRVSELDVTGANGPQAQADQYASVLKGCLQAPNCTRLTIWGLDDGHGSTAGLDSKRQLRLGNALPYTVDYQPKQARQAMKDVLKAA